MPRFLDALTNHGSNHNSSTPPSTASSPSSGRSDLEEEQEFKLNDNIPETPDPVEGNHIDSAELAALVAHHGHAPATAWLERTRYSIWRPLEPVPQSSFVPVQGYLHAKGWVFAWGSPLVSDKAALAPTVTQFIAWVQSHDMRIVYCCVAEDTEELLAGMNWSTVSCIKEDVIDLPHILELTRKDDKGGHGSMVKDLKKNLRRAERANVMVKHILPQDWSDDLRREVEHGITAWKKARKGLQLAATSFDPWLDLENREYWIALQNERVVGISVLTPAGEFYVIKNAVQFPHAPKGTSELLIHSALQDLHEHHSRAKPHLKVTFNISAARDLKATRNISGIKFAWLNHTYTKIASSACLLNRHDFRRKFDAVSQPMFICYPSEDGIGLEGIEKLLKLLLR